MELRKSLGLTPQEQRIVDFHDETMRTGKIGRDSMGRPVTVNSTGVLIKEGPLEGSFVAVPGFNRETGKLMSEAEAFKYWRKEIEAGKWPIYPSGTELNRRSQEIHKIMDHDADKMR
jgi:hypothetical protein